MQTKLGPMLLVMDAREEGLWGFSSLTREWFPGLRLVSMVMSKSNTRQIEVDFVISVVSGLRRQVS